MVPDFFRTFRPEPALILGIIGAIGTFLVSLNVTWLSASALAAIMALLTAIVTAVFTKPVAPALYVGVLAAASAVAAQYGLHWSDGAVAALSGVILAAFALFGIRPQVVPTNARNEEL
jgi:hypothetical protein